VLIFARTKKRTDRVAKFLAETGYKANRIHGDRTQKQRSDALEGFRDGKFRILVATDIAARGIDVAHIAHVINYDLPSVPEDYIHRIGRTARAGAAGEALSLLTPEDRLQWRDISRLLSKSEPMKPRVINA
jgi:superfamily II DNA/RNA helicase